MTDRHIVVLLVVWVVVLPCCQGTASGDFLTALAVVSGVAWLIVCRTGPSCATATLLLPILLMLPRVLIMSCNFPQLLPGLTMYGPVTAAVYAVIFAVGRTRVSLRMGLALLAFNGWVTYQAWSEARTLNQTEGPVTPLVMFALGGAFMLAGLRVARLARRYDESRGLARAAA